MEKQKMDSIYKEALCTWGVEAQLAMVAEEATELATAALHVLRNRPALEQLAEEAADMEIMLSQLRLMIGGKRIDGKKAIKLERLRKTLNEVNNVFLDNEEDVKRIAG
ncbi:hypothetical protein [Desulfoplanes formicivorans]|uniref:Uncharacterized protein n=1 Tax=Desulfoplanes formicivorans TaxID=1592317 RepID=A0A194ADF6_9BACT|nr:hypothetical protein [Desulfoplanes formicivorans]GAU08122.1 hypothetical protein DPF_0825 [Desulfoplanes formicivorans]